MTDLATLGLAIDSTAAVKATVDLAQFSSAAKSAGQSAEALGLKSASSNASINATVATTRNATAALKSMSAAHAENFSALDQGSVAHARNFAALGLASSQTKDHTTVLQSATTAHGAHRLSLGHNVIAINEHSQAIGLNRNQMMESVHVAKAFIDEIAAGQNPLRALAVESGRIGQIFASGSGGITGTLQGFGTAIGGLLSPTVLLGGAIVGLGGAAVYAYASFANGQDRIARSLEGVGRATGTTLAGLNAIAAAGAKSGNISLGQSNDLASTFAGSGVLDSSQIGGLITGTKAYARALGTDLPTAAERLAAAMKDPSKGAADLNKELGFLDAATLRQIEDMQRSGNLMGAQNLLLEKQAKAVDQVADRTWNLSHAWDTVKNSASNGINAAGGAIAAVLDPNEDDRLRQAIARRNTAQGLLAGMMGFKSSSRTLFKSESPDDEVSRTQEDVILRGRRARMAGELVNNNRLSLEAQPIVDRNNDEPEKLRKLVHDRALLNEAVQKGIDLGPGAAGAFERLNSQINNFTFSAQRAAQDGALMLKSIDAWTLSEKVAVDVERARIAAIHAGKDALTTSIDMENARNTAIARANDTAEKGALAAHDALSLVGLSPLAKAMKQIDIEMRDKREQLVLDKGDRTGLSAGPITPFNLGLEQGRTAVGEFTAAIRESAIALRGAGVAPSYAGPSGGIGSDTVAAMIAKSAAARGIDPQVAVRVAKSEGLGAGNYVGDNGSSFGPFQLHYGGVATGGNKVGGLGDVFTAHTGLDARNPATTQQQVDFSLDEAKRSGWGAWHGAARVGIGNRDGLGGSLPVASTAAASLNAEDADKRKAALLGLTTEALAADNRRLTEQNSLLDINIATYGRSAYAIAVANEREKETAQLRANGIKDLTSYNAKISENADLAGKTAQKQADFQTNQQKTVGQYDAVRGASTDILGGVAHAIANREDPGKALQASLAGIGGKLIDSGVGSITSSLFGGQGKIGGGIFGDLLGGVLGGGGKDMAIKANNVTVTGAGSGLGNLGGGGSSGGGILGLFGSLFGSLFGGGSSGGIGHNAAGTDNWRGGLSVVGERGPEIVNIPRGAQVIPNHIAARGGGNTTSIQSRGGDVIIQGNADANMLPQIQAMIESSQARHAAILQRNLGDMQGQWSRSYGS